MSGYKVKYKLQNRLCDGTDKKSLCVDVDLPAGCLIKM